MDRTVAATDDRSLRRRQSNTRETGSGLKLLPGFSFIPQRDPTYILDEETDLKADFHYSI